MSDQRELLMEILAEVRAEREADTEAAVNYARSFRTLWDEEVGAPLAANWYKAVKLLHNKGLSGTDLYDAVMVTAGSVGVLASGKWRYFCGVANNKLKADIEATLSRAEELADEDEGVQK